MGVGVPGWPVAGNCGAGDGAVERAGPIGAANIAFAEVFAAPDGVGAPGGVGAADFWVPPANVAAGGAVFAVSPPAASAEAATTFFSSGSFLSALGFSAPAFLSSGGLASLP